jgi:hypothetical protein
VVEKFSFRKETLFNPHLAGNRRGEPMIEREHIDLDLPSLDRRDDPRGGAAAWALLAVGAALAVGILVVIWAVSL